MAAHAPIMPMPKFPTQRQLIPFKTFVKNNGGLTGTYYIPKDDFNPDEYFKQQIRAYRQCAQVGYNSHIIYQTPESYNQLLQVLNSLAIVRGHAVFDMLHDTAPSISLQKWDPVDFKSNSDELVFEVLVSDTEKPDMGPKFSEALRFVVAPQHKQFFNLANRQGLIRTFLLYAQQHTRDVVKAPYDKQVVDVLDDITRQCLSPSFNADMNQTGPSLGGKFYQFNDVSVSDVSSTQEFSGQFQGLSYKASFSHNAPRFAATEGYMHTGVLERANQVLKEVFSVTAFSYEMRVEVTPQSGRPFTVSWTVYRYSKLKNDMYQITCITPEPMDFEKTDIKTIVDNPLSSTLSNLNLIRVQHFQMSSKHANRLQENELLKEHAAQMRVLKTDLSQEFKTYLYHFNFWTFIASFIPITNINQPGTVNHGIVITLINKMSDFVYESKERLQDNMALAERMRVAHLTEINTVVTGQNKLLRDLIDGVNRRIGQLPIKTSELPQGNTSTWLIFGTSKTDRMDRDMTLEIRNLTPDKRQAMERKSNLIKAEILNRYFSTAILEDQAKARQDSKTPNVFDYLYNTKEMQDFIALSGYDKFEKICPGVFALVIRAFPRGYKDDIKRNNTPAVDYWHDCIETMLTEFGIRPDRFNTKNGDSFAPEVQFYIDSVLAHQNKKRRQPRQLLNTDRSVLYQFSAPGNPGPNPPSLFRYDGASRRAPKLLQAQIEKPETKDCQLQGDIDALRRSVNQLALMQN